MNAAEAATTQSRLATSLASSGTAIVAETRAKTALSMQRRLGKGSRRRRVVVGSVRRDAIRLAVHASLAIWTKTALTISGVVLVIVRVAVVGVVVTGILLTMRLRLRALSGLLALLTLLGWLLSRRLSLRLGLGDWVRSAGAAVLGIVRVSTESRLVM